MGEHWSRLRRSSHSQAGISGALGELGMEDTSLPCAGNFARPIAVLWPELSRLPPQSAISLQSSLSPWEKRHHSHVSHR